MQLPSTFQELERVYQRIIAANAQVVAISAVASGSGTSLLVDALANRASAVGRSVLVVDCNLHHPRRIVSPVMQDGLFGFSETRGIALASPVSVPEQRLILREPQALMKQFHQWKQAYDFVLIDCSALERNNAGNLACIQLMATADKSVLVVASDHNSAPQLKKVTQELKQAGAEILGIVMNDRTQPSLQEELIREVSRIEKIFPKFAGWLNDRLRRSRLLSVEV